MHLRGTFYCHSLFSGCTTWTAGFSSLQLKTCESPSSDNVHVLLSHRVYSQCTYQQLINRLKSAQRQSNKVTLVQWANGPRVLNIQTVRHFLDFYTTAMERIGYLCKTFRIQRNLQYLSCRPDRRASITRLWGHFWWVTGQRRLADTRGFLWSNQTTASYLQVHHHAGSLKGPMDGYGIRWRTSRFTLCCPN